MANNQEMSIIKERLKNLKKIAKSKKRTVQLVTFMRICKKFVHELEIEIEKRTILVEKEKILEERLEIAEKINDAKQKLIPIIIVGKICDTNLEYFVEKMNYKVRKTSTYYVRTSNDESQKQIEHCFEISW
jgi:hypothetical protein